jgi:hypothetical protein
LYVRADQVEDDDHRFGCGSYFSYHADMRTLGRSLGPECYHVVCYERLTEDFDGEVRRLAEFLRVPLSERKLSALKQRTALGAPLWCGMVPTVATARSGAVGGHREHLTDAHWRALDRRAAKQQQLRA